MRAPRTPSQLGSEVWESYAGLHRAGRLSTDPEILARLDPAARDHLLKTSLSEQGVTDFGRITVPGWNQGQPGLELFFKGERMPIARWPDEGFARIASIDVEGNTPLRNRVTLSGQMRGSNEGCFVIHHCSRWNPLYHPGIAVFGDCTPSVHVDARGLGWAAGAEEMLIDLLEQYPLQGGTLESKIPDPGRPP